MRQVLVLALLGFTYLALGAELTSVSVTGQENALVRIAGDLPSESVSWKVVDNTIEFTISQASLAKDHGEKIELISPHALVKRLTFIQASGQAIKGKLIVNGSSEELAKRVKLAKSGDSLVLVVDYPKQNSSALRLLQEEQTPLANLAGGNQTNNQSNSRYVFTLVTLFLVLVSVGIFFLLRILRTKGALRGARKYLIEQLGYCPIGPKSGVSLLKVGKEFVLVGITPNQISMLSHLPKLQEQYEDETGFERVVFKEAVAEEVQRLK
jgi:flagellar biogenesis protein FliO